MPRQNLPLFIFLKFKNIDSKEDFPARLGK